MTKQELLSLYEEIDGMSIKEKRELASQWGCGSKSKELQHEILLKLRDLRKDYNVFDEDDDRSFWRLCDWVERYDKIEPFLKEESIEFVKFLRDKRLEYIKSKRYDKYLGYKSGACPAVKSVITRYENLVRFLNENSDDYKAQVETTKLIATIIGEQMTEYKQEFLKRVKEQSERIYKKIEKDLPETEEKRKQAIQNRNMGLKREIENSWTYKNSYIVKMNKTCEDFIEKEVKSADNEFDRSVESVSMRVQKKGLEIDNIKINKIKSDPKFFELLITDGKKKLYARSIIAAEYSDKMIAHFRFIITERR